MLASTIAAFTIQLPSTAGLPIALAWQDGALLVAGLLLLLLAVRVAYRRRRAALEEDIPPIPLIDIPTPTPPGQPLRVQPKPVPEQHGTQRFVLEPAVGAAVEDWGEEVQAGPVRFRRPPEGTLQLLPGRLEIVSGKEGVDEIRFVRVPGKDPVITFGRSAGEPHVHIELQSPTVSRKHAAMRFHKGAWHIANLSKTNPVVVRGKTLGIEDAPVRLEDGDRVEMGEVTFRFHAR